ncbi:enhancer of mRNA-decapping protein 4-like isoform X1 [Ostrinia furnacalis]|uniref:enhancer of mRNA-decapping protein 4-like isoform X1 n=1 Tax=Ostrinia furnacalis TaxID=93504 RepID=UPI00103ECDB3|nr:enhancer of mRNA-decapping protein 4-like isoform X1 [Ostrinia furnacalis]
MDGLPQQLKEDGAIKCFRRSKSMSSLSDDINMTFYQIDNEPIKQLCGYAYACRSYTVSGSSVEAYRQGPSSILDSDSEPSVHGRKVAQDGASSCDGEAMLNLERKIDRLSHLFEEQCKMLGAIKDEVQESKAPSEGSGYGFAHMLAEVVNKSKSRIKELVQSDSSESLEPNPRAKSLLDAIETKRASSLDGHVRDALTAFLQSDELRSRVASATAASVRSVVRDGARGVSAACLPALARQHRRLARQVSRTLEDAFAELEENSAQLSRHMHKTTRDLRRALDAHSLHAPDTHFADALRNTVEELLDKELKQWRQKVLDIIVTELQAEYFEDCSAGSSEPPDCPLSPSSPPQPADPERSIIDQLMQSAEINKQILDGDVNGSFERALSAADLSLVMAACRAADPAHVFAPCRLQQPVLLSLAQQLATDMLHETQLKCRYLEETIINLNASDPATRTHLPLVIGEVRKHLIKFLLSYPNHVAGRRVTLIVMAADNLLKQCN